MKKYNFLYLTKNLINKKIYIGVHSTNNLKDGYLGSGKHLLRAIEKYGKENFKRYILVTSSDLTLIYKLEHQIVTQDFVRKDFNYNIEIGGNKVQHSEETKRKIGKGNKNKVFSKETRMKLSLAKKGKYLLSKNNNAKKVLNLDTNIIFDSAKEAAIAENMNYSTFKWAVKYSKSFNYRYFKDELSFDDE